MSTSQGQGTSRDAAGRVPRIVGGQLRRYRTMTDEERQSSSGREYEQRDPADPYATSRDYNARELEMSIRAPHSARPDTLPGPRLRRKRLHAARPG